MNPAEKKASKTKSPLMFFLIGLILFTIGFSIGFAISNTQEMAPGSFEMEDVEEPRLIAKTVSNDDGDVIQSTGVDMPDVVVPKAEAESFGKIKTENGEYNLSGL